MNRFTEAGHEVVIIETNKDRIDELSEILDCGFIHGDGTRPDVLKEVDPKKTDILVCGTNDDNANIIATLLAKTLEFKKVITMISNVELEKVSENLQLESTIFSAKTISNYLEELIHGRDVFEMTRAVRDTMRLFTFRVSGENAKPVKEINMPDKSKIVWIYRENDYFFAEPDTVLQAGDTVAIATNCDHLEELNKQFPNG